MQGAFVFNQEYDNFLVMYKEISNDVIFYLIYGNKYLKYNYITIFDFYYLFGNVYNYLHIINYLPFHYNINITMNLWKSIAFNRLQEFY